MASYRLSERILIQNFIDSQDDEGFSIQKWDDFYPCWSSFKSISGSEFIAAKANNSENIVTFTIRYCKKAKALLNNTKNFRIKYNNKYYDIVYVDDFRSRHKFIDIKATLTN